MKVTRIITGIVLVLFFTSNSFSQHGYGNFMIGGKSSVSFSSNNLKWKSDDDEGERGKQSNFSFSPEVGFFIANGLALGLEIPVSRSSYTDTQDDKDIYTSISIDPFVRYYVGGSIYRPYVHGQGGFGSSKTKYESAGEVSEYSYSLLTYKFGGGLGVFLGDMVSLDIGLYYGSRSTKAKENNDTNRKNITSGISTDIGVLVFF